MKLQSGRVGRAWLMDVPCGVSQGNSHWACCRVRFQDGALRWLTSCSSGQLGAQPCLGARGFDPSHLGNSCLGSLGFLTAWWLAHRQEHHRAKWRCIELSWSNFASYIAPLLLYPVGQSGHHIPLKIKEEGCKSYHEKRRLSEWPYKDMWHERYWFGHLKTNTV